MYRRDLRFRSVFDGGVDISKEFSSGDGSLSSPGAAGPRRWPEGRMSPRANCMIPSQSAKHPEELGFHTVRGGVDPGDDCIPPRGVRVVQVWEDFSSGDGNLSSPGCTGSIYDPQPISERPVEVVFPHRDARIYTRDRSFCPQVVKVVKVSSEFGSRNETISSPGAVGSPRRVRWNRDIVPTRASRCELARYAPASLQPVSGFNVFTPCGVVSTIGICVFVPGLIEL